MPQVIQIKRTWRNEAVTISYLPLKSTRFSASENDFWISQFMYCEQFFLFTLSDSFWYFSVLQYYPVNQQFIPSVRCYLPYERKLPVSSGFQRSWHVPCIPGKAPNSFHYWEWRRFKMRGHPQRSFLNRRVENVPWKILWSQSHAKTRRSGPARGRRPETHNSPDATWFLPSLRVSHFSYHFSMPRNPHAAASTLRNRNRITNKTRLKIHQGPLDADNFHITDEDEERHQLTHLAAGVDAEESNVSSPLLLPCHH